MKTLHAQKTGLSSFAGADANWVDRDPPIWQNMWHSNEP